LKRHAAIIADRPCRCRDGQAERLPTGHEDVLTAVVVERFPGESAIESFQAQARDVEEPQPFVLGCSQSEPVPPSSKVMSTRLSLTL
jgi:hypothetical protein